MAQPNEHIRRINIHRSILQQGDGQPLSHGTKKAKYLLTALTLCALMFSSMLLAETLGPFPKYADQDYDPLPVNYAEIAKQHVASQFKDSTVCVDLVVGPLHTAYPVEIDGMTDYRPCWSLLLKTQDNDGEQTFIIFLYRDRVVGTMTTKP